MFWVIMGAIVVLGLYMAWTVGANDAANSMANAVGSRAISLKWAVVLCCICELAGAVLVGTHVTDTIREGIVNPAVLGDLCGLPEADAAALFAVGMAAALLASALWLHLATWFGMPVSTTHAIVGGVAGFGIVAGGWSAVQWGRMVGIVASWFISPVAGGIMGFVLFKVTHRLVLANDRPARAAIGFMPFIVFFSVSVVAISTFYKGLAHLIKGVAWLSGTNGILVGIGIGVVAAVVSRLLIAPRLRPYESAPLPQQLERVERVFSPLVVITACTIAFAHGANDVANAVGPLAAVADIMQSGTLKLKDYVPLWVLGLGGVGIVLGVSTFGYRVMRTMGEEITQLTPSRGVCAAVAACTTVLVCTKMGLPISTTHTAVGAIVGIGLARGLAAVNRNVLKNVFTSWLITVPASAVLAVVLFLIGRALVLGHVLDVVRAAGGRGP